MGADLYLPSVLQTCFTRYGRAAQLVDALHSLVQGNVSQALREEGLALKTALHMHAEQQGSMSPALFDLVAEIADLAQEELTVWGNALASQIVERLDQRHATSSTRPEDQEPTNLAHALVDLLQGHPERAMAHAVPWLAERLEQLASQAPAEEEVLWQALAQLGQRMREVHQGHPDPALALVLEHRLLPELEQACTDQAACLSVLDGALAILEQTSSAEGTDAPVTFVPAQVLARWRDTAGQIHEAMHTLWTVLSLQRQQPPVSSQVVAQHLHLAWETVQTLWQEVGALQEALGAALSVLGTLLMRTLPSFSDAPMGDASGVAHSPDAAAAPAFPASSPLRQSVGTILKHQEICHHAVHMLEQAVQMVDALLGEDQEQALLALSEEMVSLLAIRQCDQAHQEEAAFTRQTESLAPPIPLTTGVSLIPGSLMDSHYLERQNVLHQALHEYHAQVFVNQSLGEQQATHAGGLALSFWRLLRGDGLHWASLLVRLIEEQLPTGPDDALLRAWLTQLQGLFHGEPQERLQALLTELAEQLPADSPLQRPYERFTCLLQQQTDVFVREALLALTEEVQGQAERDAWPADRVADLRWVLDVLCGWLQAAEDDRAALLLSTLVNLIETRQGVPAATSQEVPDGEMEVLLANLAGMTDGQARLRIIQHLLAALPEEGPQPARADPRANPWWRFHLLRELLDGLIGQQASAAEPGLAADDADDGEPRPLLEPVTVLLIRLLVAWRFPAEGYFRDPYNDASILWVSAGLFWPMIAQGIAEPLDAEALAHSDWHHGEGEIPAQIPVDHACKLSECLATHTPQLPSREQLARWGVPLSVEEDGPWSMQNWHTHFAEQRRALVAFLEGAILREEPIFCSL
jgi:hypothetical protein